MRYLLERGREKINDIMIIYLNYEVVRNLKMWFSKRSYFFINFFVNKIER